MIENNKIVFIVGCYRSGTTLLRNMLDVHTEIAITPELRFFDIMLAKRKEIHKSNKSNSKKSLAEYIIARIKKNKEENLDNWGETKGDFNDLYKRLIQSEDEKEVFLNYAEACASKNKYSVLIEKTPINIFFIDRIVRLFPSAKFIHIVRDGREVCASACKRWDIDYYRPAARWNFSVSTFNYFRKKYIENSFIEVKYEDIVGGDVNKILADLFKFLGVEYRNYDFSKLSEMNNTSSFKTNKKGLYKSKNFSEFFEEKYHNSIEALLWKNLAKYGYVKRKCKTSFWNYFKYIIEYTKVRVDIFFRRIGYYAMYKRLIK